jgi:peroxiredoxin Q/BCP
MSKEGSQLAVGNKAPAFRALAVGGEFGEGREVALEDLRGGPVVLYFYPKDDTPGCTAQACGLRDSWASVQGKAQIFGVSVDSPKSHRKFIDKYDLPFPLLSDPEKEIVNAYGVWVEKSMYGRKYMGAERSTFIVDATGRIAAIFRKVKPEEHVDLVRGALKNLADK